MFQLDCNLGNALLLIAFLFSLPLKNRFFSNNIAMAANFFLIFASVLSIIFYYVTDNFSYEIVYHHSHTNMPLLYKISAFWSSYEGSMLLWVFVLSLYRLFFSLIVKSDDTVYITALNIQSTLLSIFIIFVIIIANPFLQLQVSPSEGIGLPPSLQDYMFSIHPPFLYLGYAGFYIIFTIALAVLLTSTFTTFWANALRLFTLVPLGFLLIGIILGMLWSYKELGWGGIWAWDPVENVSLMPLILAISLFHSLVVVKKYNNLKNFSLFLSILIFNSVLIGMFISRSSILDSIHSFAENEEKNLYMMIVMIFIHIVSFGIFIFSKFDFSSDGVSSFAPSSRTGFIILGNVFFILSFSTIMCGSLMPLISKQLFNLDITINAKYYNNLLGKIIAIMIPIIAFAPRIHWTEKLNIKKIIKNHAISLGAILCSLLFFYNNIKQYSFMSILLITFSEFLILSVLENFFHKVELINFNFSIIIQKIKMLSRVYWSTNIAHFGFGMLILSLCLMFHSRVEIEKELKLGDSIVVVGYEILAKNIQIVQNKNFEAIKGEFVINHQIKLSPEYRFYKAEKSFSSESDTAHILFSDIMINITSFNYKNKIISINIIYNPYIQLIWIALTLITASFLISLTKKFI